MLWSYHSFHRLNKRREHVSSMRMLCAVSSFVLALLFFLSFRLLFCHVAITTRFLHGSLSLTFPLHRGYRCHMLVPNGTVCDAYRTSGSPKGYTPSWRLRSNSGGDVLHRWAHPSFIKEGWDLMRGEARGKRGRTLGFINCIIFHIYIIPNM